MGKIITIGEHYYPVPEPPRKSIIIPGVGGLRHTLSLDDLVINKNERPNNAYWHRVGPNNLPIEQDPYPAIWDEFIPGYTKIFQDTTRRNSKNGALESLSEDDTKLISYLFAREMYRRTHGVHFKNGNDIEYLTEDYYFTLQWMKMKGAIDADGNKIDYGMFRKFQRDTTYLMQQVKRDRDCMGLFISKPKKTGITQIMAGYYVNKSTRMAEQNMGVMSYDMEKITIPTNMGFYFYGYDELPNIFKPAVKYRSMDKIEFGNKESGSTSAAKTARMAKSIPVKPLNTTVYAAATKVRAFDAPVMNDMWFDEFGKLDTGGAKVMPEEVWEQNKEAIKIQDIINGKAWITFYPPEKDTKGFYQTKKIYFDSKLKTKENRRLTKSGLYCFHISSLNSYSSCFNKNGDCDEKKALAINDEEREAIQHDKKKLQAAKRQYGRDEKEAWSSGGAGSTFDNMRIGELQDLLEVEMAAGRLFVDGRLEWTNVMWELGRKDKRPVGQFCPVRFIPLTREEIARGDIGRLRIYNNVPFGPDDYNEALKYGRDSANNLLPPPSFKKVGAADPTDYAAGSEVVQGSKNAYCTYTAHDPVLNAKMGKVASKLCLSEYFFRPDNPTEAYEDLVKEIIFFGKLVIVEANKAWMATKLIEDGLGYYMLVKNEEGIICRWEPGMKYRLIRTEVGSDEKGSIVRVISHYLFKAEGEGEIDYGPHIKSERFLSQCEDFDPDDTKLFDLVMCHGYGLIALEINDTITVHPTNYTKDNMSAILSGFYGGYAKVVA